MGIIRSIIRASRGRRRGRGRPGRSGGSIVLVWSIIPEVIAAVEANAVEAVAQTAEDIAASAREQAPVQTGHLRSTIEGFSSGKEGEVVAGAEYAAYVEYGTYKMAAQPFLFPAVAEYTETFADRVGRGGFAKWGGV
jgi:HK97 gp10 family phage protein